MPLDAFLGLLTNFPSLEEARVISLETHGQRRGLRPGSSHWALVAHMRREGRADAWLRLEHLRSRHDSRLGLFVRNTRVRAAQVTVTVADVREKLLERGGATPENRLEFDRMPTLGVLSLFLANVCQGLSGYGGGKVRKNSTSCTRELASEVSCAI